MAHRERRCHLVGWWVFVGSAACFIITGVRSGDTLTIIGGVLFLLGCLIFLYPMAYRPKGCEAQGEAASVERAGVSVHHAPSSDENDMTWQDVPVCSECGQGASGVPRNGPGARDREA